MSKEVRIFKRGTMPSGSSSIGILHFKEFFQCNSDLHRHSRNPRFFFFSKVKKKKVSQGQNYRKIVEIRFLAILIVVRWKAFSIFIITELMTSQEKLTCTTDEYQCTSPGTRVLIAQGDLIREERKKNQ